MVSQGVANTANDAENNETPHSRGQNEIMVALKMANHSCFIGKALCSGCALLIHTQSHLSKSHVIPHGRQKVVNHCSTITSPYAVFNCASSTLKKQQNNYEQESESISAVFRVNRVFETLVHMFHGPCVCHPELFRVRPPTNVYLDQ